MDASQKHLEPKSPAGKTNQRGQAMGRKGEETRLCFIEATEALLQNTPLRQLKVAEIAKAANTATATFYVYFRDADDVVESMIEKRQVLPDSLLTLLEGDWLPKDRITKARLFIDEYIRFWDANYHVFRIRNFIADSGNERMVRVRYNFMLALIERLAAKIAQAWAAAGQASPMDPMAGAAVILASLERIASTMRLATTQPEVVRPQAVLEAEAWMLAQMLGGGANSGNGH